MDFKKDFEPTFAKLHKGAHYRIVFVSDKGNGYTKRTQAVVRFVRYDHIKGVVPSQNAKPNPNVQCLIPGVATYNANTGNTLISMATTHITPKCQYFHNGVGITKAEFDQATNAKPSKPTKWMTVKCDNIIELGKK